MSRSTQSKRRRLAAVLAIAGVIFAPVVHRFLHYLHADPDEEPSKGGKRTRPSSKA